MTEQSLDIGRDQALEFFDSFHFFERFKALQTKFPWGGEEDANFPKSMIMESLRARLPMARLRQKKIRHGHMVSIAIDEGGLQTQVNLEFTFGRIEPFFSAHPIEGWLGGPLQYLSRELCGEPAIIPPAPKNIWEIYLVLDGILDIVQDYIDGIRSLLSAPKIDWDRAAIFSQPPENLIPLPIHSKLLVTGASQQNLFEKDYKIELEDNKFTVTPAFLGSLESLTPYMGESAVQFLSQRAKGEGSDFLYYRRAGIISAFRFYEKQPALYAFELIDVWLEEYD